MPTKKTVAKKTEPEAKPKPPRKNPYKAKLHKCGPEKEKEVKTSFGLHLPVELLEKLKEKAKDNGICTSALVCQMLERYLIP